MNERTTPIASTLADSTTRRGALRFLTGLAMAGSGLSALGAADAGARNKKKNKRKGKKGNKGFCGDKRRARVQVPHDGTVVYTEKLEAGKRYTLHVSGHVTGTAPLLVNPVGIDAGHIFRQEDGSTTTHDSINGIDYGLAVDGAAAAWGDYASNHVYERKVVGEGKKLALHLVTEAESSFNNSAQGQLSARRLISTPIELNLSGSLTVEVLCD
jgi:hypothetical protein